MPRSAVIPSERSDPLSFRASGASRGIRTRRRCRSLDSALRAALGMRRRGALRAPLGMTTGAAPPLKMAVELDQTCNRGRGYINLPP